MVIRGYLLMTCYKFRITSNKAEVLYQPMELVMYNEARSPEENMRVQ